MERGIITISENGTVCMPTIPVWMTQYEMADALGVFGCEIRKAIRPSTKTTNCWKVKLCGTSGRTTEQTMTCIALKW